MNISRSLFLSALGLTSQRGSSPESSQRELRELLRWRWRRGAETRHCSTRKKEKIGLAAASVNELHKMQNKIYIRGERGGREGEEAAAKL